MQPSATRQSLPSAIRLTTLFAAPNCGRSRTPLLRTAISSCGRSMQPPARKIRSERHRCRRPQQVGGTIPEPKKGPFTVCLMRDGFSGRSRLLTGLRELVSRCCRASGRGALSSRLPETGVSSTHEKARTRRRRYSGGLDFQRTCTRLSFLASRGTSNCPSPVDACQVMESTAADDIN